MLVILIYYILGSGYSNGVDLDVLHPPECAPGQVQLYAVQKHKSIKVLKNKMALKNINKASFDLNINFLGQM